MALRVLSRCEAKKSCGIIESSDCRTPLKLRFRHAFLRLPLPQAWYTSKEFRRNQKCQPYLGRPVSWRLGGVFGVAPNSYLL